MHMGAMVMQIPSVTAHPSIRERAATDRHIRAILDTCFALLSEGKYIKKSKLDELKELCDMSPHLLPQGDGKKGTTTAHALKVESGDMHCMVVHLQSRSTLLSPFNRLCQDNYEQTDLDMLCDLAGVDLMFHDVAKQHISDGVWTEEFFLECIDKGLRELFAGCQLGKDQSSKSWLHMLGKGVVLYARENNSMAAVRGFMTEMAERTQSKKLKHLVDTAQPINLLLPTIGVLHYTDLAGLDDPDHLRMYVLMQSLPFIRGLFVMVPQNLNIGHAMMAQLKAHLPDVIRKPDCHEICLVINPKVTELRFGSEGIDVVVVERIRKELNAEMTRIVNEMMRKDHTKRAIGLPDGVNMVERIKAIVDGIQFVETNPYMAMVLFDHISRGKLSGDVQFFINSGRGAWRKSISQAMHGTGMLQFACFHQRQDRETIAQVDTWIADVKSLAGRVADSQGKMAPGGDDGLAAVAHQLWAALENDVDDIKTQVEELWADQFSPDGKAVGREVERAVSYRLVLRDYMSKHRSATDDDVMGHMCTKMDHGHSLTQHETTPVTLERLTAPYMFERLQIVDSVKNMLSTIIGWLRASLEPLCKGRKHKHLLKSCEAALEGARLDTLNECRLEPFGRGKQPHTALGKFLQGKEGDFLDQAFGEIYARRDWLVEREAVYRETKNRAVLDEIMGEIKRLSLAAVPRAYEAVEAFLGSGEPSRRAFDPQRFVDKCVRAVRKALRPYAEGGAGSSQVPEAFAKVIGKLRRRVQDLEKDSMRIDAFATSTAEDTLNYLRDTRVPVGHGPRLAPEDPAALAEIGLGEDEGMVYKGVLEATFNECMQRAFPDDGEQYNTLYSVLGYGIHNAHMTPFTQLVEKVARNPTAMAQLDRLPDLQLCRDPSKYESVLLELFAVSVETRWGLPVVLKRSLDEVKKILSEGTVARPALFITADTTTSSLYCTLALARPPTGAPAGHVGEGPSNTGTSAKKRRAGDGEEPRPRAAKTPKQDAS